MMQRRTSETGRRNFRSKRFSRNMERDNGSVGGGPGLRRAHSLHMERRTSMSSRDHHREQDEDEEDWVAKANGRMVGGQSESSTSEDQQQSYTAQVTATSTTNVQGPGGIGSYLSRREFGSNEGSGQPQADSGYQSHGSGAGAYPKMQLPVSETTQGGSNVILFAELTMLQWK